MISGILAKKLGMTQIFQNGRCVPVTVLEVTPNTVLQVKTKEKDGYYALQLGFGDKKKGGRKTELGHLQKHAKTGLKRFVKEVGWDGKDEIAAGQAVNMSIFENLHFVDVVGISKGKGFQGGVKRHHFAGGPTSHGQSDRKRAPGSIGATSQPSRVFKGQRMAGRMGNHQCTSRNLRLVELNKEQNLVIVEGGVVGPNGGYVMIKRALRVKQAM